MTEFTLSAFPVLSAGAHRDHRAGVCVMEYVSLLAGEPWSDEPSCTHPIIAAVARAANDIVPDPDRQQLVSLVPRLVGTNDGRDGPGEQHELTVRLVAWCLRRLPVIAPPGWRDAFVEAVDVAVGLLTDKPAHRDLELDARQHLGELVHLAQPGSAVLFAARAVRRALSFRESAGPEGRIALRAAACDAVRAVPDRIAFLTGLLDFHDLFVGRRRPSVVEEVWTAFAASSVQSARTAANWHRLAA